MRRWMWWTLVALVVSVPVVGLAQLEETAEAGSELPPPVEYAEWKAPLWPESSRSVLVVGQSPETSERFRAYGVDAVSQKVVFAIEGRWSDYPRFAAEAAEQSLQRVLPCQIFLGQIPLPLPPPPPSPTGDPYNPSWEILTRANAAVEGNCR